MIVYIVTKKTDGSIMAVWADKEMAEIHAGTHPDLEWRAYHVIK